MSDLNLNIYTPNGVVIKGLECESLLIPTSRGQINVLKNHTQLITEMGTGVLVAKTQVGTRNFTMTAGLCKVLGKEVTILSTTSEKAEDIDLERANAAKAKAESRLAGGGLPSVEMIKFQRKVQRAKLRIKLANLK